MLFFHHLYKPAFTVMFSFMLGKLCALVYVCFLGQGRLIWFSLLWFKLSPSVAKGCLKCHGVTTLALQQLWLHSQIAFTSRIPAHMCYYEPMKKPISYTLIWLLKVAAVFPSVFLRSSVGPRQKKQKKSGQI